MRQFYRHTLSATSIGVLFIVLLIILVKLFVGNTEDTTCSKCAHLTAGVEGNSMSPLIQNGDIVEYFVGWYSYHTPKPGDIIIYDFGGSNIPVIKQVRVTDRETVEIDFEQKILKINSKPLENSVGDIYTFTDAELQMMENYIIDGKIPRDSVFIFGDNIGHSNDSRKFGAVSRSNLLGRVFLGKKKS